MWRAAVVWLLWRRVLCLVGAPVAGLRHHPACVAWCEAGRVGWLTAAVFGLAGSGGRVGCSGFLGGCWGGWERCGEDGVEVESFSGPGGNDCLVVDVVFDGEVVWGEDVVDDGGGLLLGGDFRAVGAPDTQAAVMSLQVVGVVVNESVVESAE